MIDNFVRFVMQYLSIELPSDTTLSVLHDIENIIGILYHEDCSDSDIEQMRSDVQSILDRQARLS